MIASNFDINSSRVLAVDKMLCDVCVWMLRGRRGQIFGGTLGLHFVHHDSAESFWTSVARDCSICRPLGDKVNASPALRTVAPAHDQAFLGLRSLAYLSAVPPGSDSTVTIYRLDFTVESAGHKFRHTFVLRPLAFQGCFQQGPLSLYKNSSLADGII